MSPEIGKVRTKTNLSGNGVGLSRLRGGRFACNTPRVMFHERTTISIQLLSSRLTHFHMIENP